MSNATSIKRREQKRRVNARLRGAALRERVTEFDCSWCGTHHTVGITCAPHASKFCPGELCKRRFHNNGQRPRSTVWAERIHTITAGVSKGIIFTSGQCASCATSYISPPWMVESPYCGRRCSGKAKTKRRKAIGRAIRTAVLERDQWTCQLCFDPIDPLAPLGNWSASVDHVIPISKQGTDEIDNLQAAHRWCNSVRRDADMNDAF